MSRATASARRIEARGAVAKASGDRGHGEPPFDEGPAGPLPRAGGSARMSSRYRAAASPRVVEAPGKLASRPVGRGHATALRTAWLSERGVVDRSMRMARATDAAGTSRSRAGCPGRRRLRQRHPQEEAEDDDRALLGLEAPRAHGREGRGRPRSRSSRRRSGSSRGVSSTSMARRRRRLRRSRQALTVSRWSQASNRSGSRNPGRSRQARTIASWTASRASSPSRRISRAAASSRARAW